MAGCGQGRSRALRVSTRGSWLSIVAAIFSNGMVRGHCGKMVDKASLHLPVSLPTGLALELLFSRVMPLTPTQTGTAMPQQVTARLPDSVVDALDTVAQQLRRSRADVIRLAVEHYLEDFDDLSAAVDRLRDPTDPVLDWDGVRRELLGTD